MLIKRTGQTKEGNVITGQAIGLALGTVIVLLGAVLITWMIFKNNHTTQMIGFAGWITMFVASILGAMLVSGYIRKKALLNIAIFASVFTVLCLVTNMLFFDGFSSKCWSTIISIWSGAGVCCLLRVLPKKNKRYRKIRHG